MKKELESLSEFREFITGQINNLKNLDVDSTDIEKLYRQSIMSKNLLIVMITIGKQVTGSESGNLYLSGRLPLPDKSELMELAVLTRKYEMEVEAVYLKLLGCDESYEYDPLGNISLPGKLNKKNIEESINTSIHRNLNLNDVAVLADLGIELRKKENLKIGIISIALAVTITGICIYIHSKNSENKYYYEDDYEYDDPVVHLDDVDIEVPDVKITNKFESFM